MKLCISLLSVVSIVILLSSCGFNAISIENPEIDKFEEYYVDDDFTVLIKSEIDPDSYYTRIAYGFGIKKDEQCFVGNFEEVNYMFFYKKKYYDIVEFDKFNIVSCEDLIEMGVTGE